MEQFREFEVGGERIAASIHIPKMTPAPGVVMCHGFTGQRTEAHFLFVKAARAWCELGHAVLRFDFRGSGESEGRFRDMTISREIEDALAALGALRSEPVVDATRIAMVGLSLGGLVAACAAARDGGVRALVLWSAVADIEQIIRERWMLPGEPGADGRDCYEHGAFEIGAEFFRDARDIRPLEEIARFDGPVLVVHGDADHGVPLEHAHQYMDARAESPAETRIHIVRGGDHTYSSRELEKNVITTTGVFLNDRIRRGGMRL